MRNERLDKLYERLNVSIERVRMKYEHFTEVKSSCRESMITYTN